MCPFPKPRSQVKPANFGAIADCSERVRVQCFYVRTAPTMHHLPLPNGQERTHTLLHACRQNKRGTQLDVSCVKEKQQMLLVQGVACAFRMACMVCVC